MIYCQKCGKENEFGTNFCRFCGRQFSFQETEPLQNNEYTPPRPYMWKTDEFQIRKHSARQTHEIKNVQPLIPPGNPFNSPQSMVYQQSAGISGYRCPRCGTTNLPYLKRQISTAGWVTFAVLLVLTFFLFWVGLLIREDVRICPICGLRTSI